MITSKIYGLAHPRTARIRYVGKCTGDLKRRLCDHIRKARCGKASRRLTSWVLALLARGRRPTIILLARVTRWQLAERRWIKRLRSRGHRLLNVTPGGNGGKPYARLPGWVIANMGRVSDARIAERYGKLTREAITYHRRARGISKSNDNSRVGGRAGTPAHNRVFLPAHAVERLGLEPDTALARTCGVSKTTIGSRRRALGLRPCSATIRVHGVAHHSAKITPRDAREIRARYRRYSRTANCYTLGVEYGVHPATIHAIIRGDTWRSA